MRTMLIVRSDRADVRRCIDTLDQQVVCPGRFSVERMPLEECKGIVAEARAEASVGTKSELLAQVRQGLGAGEPQIIRVEQTPKLTAFTGGGMTLMPGSMKYRVCWLTGGMRRQPSGKRSVNAKGMQLEC